MIYRNLQACKLSSISLRYKKSNIEIRYSVENCSKHDLAELYTNKLRDIYEELGTYLKENPAFKDTLEPWAGNSGSKIITAMIDETHAAGVGPMASVAGAVADELLTLAPEDCTMMIIENGGDLAMLNREGALVTLYTGWFNNFSSVHLKIPPGRWGIASSSGRYGHSFSYGDADLVTVVAESGAKADAWATAIGNRVKAPSDIESLLDEELPVQSVSIFYDEKMYHRGDIELDF